MISGLFSQIAAAPFYSIFPKGNRKHLVELGFFGVFLLFFAKAANTQTTSKIIYPANDNCLEYVSDQQNNYIVDFSYAGYRNGEAPIPLLNIVQTLDPIAGDNTEHIQEAIDQVAGMSPDADGFRGAILLKSGTYEINGTLRIHTGGIVLRGITDPDNPDNNTLLVATGDDPDKRSVIIVGTTDHDKWKEAVPGTTTAITSPFLPAGSRSLEVAGVDAFEKGDQVIVHHPSTDGWLASVNYGDTASDDPWSSGDIDILYNRYIDDIYPEQNKIVLDAPIYDHFDNSLSEAVVYVLDEPNTVRHSGVENMRIEIETEDDEDEDHAWSGIRFEGAEDCWARNVTVLHFSYAAVYTYVASRISVLRCKGLEPHSKIDGSRRYNFAANKWSNNILFQHCHASWGRHSFVTNGTASVSGIVFHKCESEHDITASEGHRQWSQALLFDNIHFTNPEGTQLMGLYNRGSWGESHGWGAVNSVAWNIVMEPQRELILQKPPGRQNYAIGCRAEVKDDYVYDHPRGYEEATGTAVDPLSLYDTQLEARLQYGKHPDAPARLSGQYSNNKVTLSWLDIAADEGGYLVVYSADGGHTFKKAAKLPANTTTYTHDNQSALMGTLIYRVAAIGGACKSPWSNTVTLETATGYCDIPVPGLEVFPNPATTNVQVRAEASLQSVMVVDMLGRVLEKYRHTNEVSTTAWQPGIYFLRIRDEEERVCFYKIRKI